MSLIGILGFFAAVGGEIDAARLFVDVEELAHDPGALRELALEFAGL